MWRGWLTCSWILIISLMFYEMVWNNLPVFRLKILIILSFRITARYVPWGLRLIDRGTEFACSSCRNSVYILHLYGKFLGKSRVKGSQIYRNPLSSIEIQKLSVQFILMNFTGCLWKETWLTMYELSSFLTSVYWFAPWVTPNAPITSSSSSSFYLFWVNSGSIIHIFPVLSSLIATSYQSLPSCGMNSQELGTKVSLIDIRRSQFRTSNILSVLSNPTEHRRSWFLDKETPVIRPLWALKFLVN